MPKLLGIADDLTGANDVGVQFAKQGTPVLVRPTVTPDGLSWPDEVEVLVVSTESRHLDGQAASERVADAVRVGIAAGASYFYKKTDSTMRGNIGTELEALLAATRSSVLPFIPAVPELKRTTLNGYQFVEGRPLHESVFADDAVERISSSYIPEIIAGQSDVPTRVIKTNQLSGQESSEVSPGIYVFDAVTDDDLAQIGACLERCGLLRVVAGSASFASLLPDMLGLARRSLTYPRVSGRMLVVSGSLNPRSVAQVASVRKEDFEVITLTSEVLLPIGDAESSRVDEAIARILSLDSEGCNGIVIRTLERHDDLRCYLERGERLDLVPRALHLRVAASIGDLVSRIMSVTDFKVLAVFGGDTLAAIVRSLGWSALWPRGEIISGVVALEVDDNTEFLLLTKAGGYGGSDLLHEIKVFLRNNQL